MRIVWLFGIVAASFIEFAILGSCHAQSTSSADQASHFKVNTVWQGEMEQSNPKSSYPVILFIKDRKGDGFEATTYYPTLGNGLLKVSGQIDEKGTVTFSEDEVVHAERLEDGTECISNTKFTGKLVNTTLKGTGELREYVDPITKKTIRLEEAIVFKFSLKVAE